MKNKMKEKTLKLIAKIAMHTAKTEVNSACICIGYQPTIPKSVMKLRKL